MHFKGLDLNLLVALDALLSERNVTRAAERVCISQPAMSAALQKLRHHFSDQLLERVGRKLELTPRGRSLAEPIKDVLFDIQSLTSALERFDPATVRRTFRLATSTYCSDLLGAPVIRALADRAPDVSCQFEDLSTDSLQRLADGRVDVVITIAPRLFSDAVEQIGELCETPLFTDRLVLVAAAGNRSMGEAIDMEELCRLPYAETRFSNDLMGIGERTWQQQADGPRTRAWLPNFQLTLDAVSRTNLVAMVPSRLISAFEGRFAVRTIPVPLEVPPLDERMFWHPRNEADPGNRWFRGLIESVVQEQGLRSELA